ncbi:semaphorin-4A [Centroberyx gerrardi]
MPGLVLLLLGLLGSSGSLPPPRISFPLNSADRPLVHFSPPGVHNTTTLLLSDDGSTLYVGARDVVLSLDVSNRDVISLKRKLDWSPSHSELQECENKGKDKTVDCPNFIRVLQPINSTHLYACGSFAYNPHDAYIDAGSLSMVRISSKAKGRCPFSPVQRSSAITVDGELFTGTMSDFRGVEPLISRHFSKDGRPDVSQDTSASLLEEPTFVGSSFDPAEEKLYFFFSEVGKEYSFVDKLKIARVAQVCKDDVGGQRTLQRRWTSFAKSPLLCQLPKQLPFNVLQDSFTLRPPGGADTGDTRFYSVFTSQWSVGSESAVCVFQLQDVRSVFAGSYRTFDMRSQQWSQLQGRHSDLGKCGLENATDAVLVEVKKSFLTSDSVKPVGGVPVVISTGHRYSRVVAMTTQAANGKEYTVLFLLTESGFLHKVVLLDQGPRVIEEVQVFTQPQPVKTIVLSSSKGVVYVGTSEGVTAVPVENCPSYRTCTQCVLARDPFCGWDDSRKVCSSLGSSPTNMAQDVENGNVGNECLRQTEAEPVSVEVHLNEAVRLQCSKPSNLATLTWTSPGFSSLPEKFFLRSADGSLSFLASSHTLGTYRCVSEEGGYQEVVARYTVRQKAPPRSMRPPPTTNIQRKTGVNPPENAQTEEPTFTVEPPRDPEENLTREPVSVSEDETIPYEEEIGFEPPTHNNVFDYRLPVTNETLDSRPRKESPLPNYDPNLKEKSYHSELVVVSLLLAVCVCLMIVGLYRWRQRKPGLKPSPLVSPQDSGEDSPSELKVLE